MTETINRIKCWRLVFRGATNHFASLPDVFGFSAELFCATLQFFQRRQKYLYVMNQNLCSIPQHSKYDIHIQLWQNVDVCI